MIRFVTNYQEDFLVALAKLRLLLYPRPWLAGKDGEFVFFAVNRSAVVMHEVIAVVLWFCAVRSDFQHGALAGDQQALQR